LLFVSGLADDRFGFPGVHREGFLTKDGSAGVETDLAVGFVSGMRRRHINNVKIVSIQEFFQTCI